MMCVLGRATAARWLSVIALARVVVIAAPAGAQDVGAPATANEREASLAELLAFADRHAPGVRLASLRRGYGDAARAGDEAPLRENPTLELGVGPRFEGGDGSDFDFHAALAQPVEVAGERGLRLAADARMAERLEAESAAARGEVRRAVTLAYRDAVLCRERSALAEDLLRFSEELLSVARRRLGAGEATAIDVRVGETDVAQARLAALGAEQALYGARLRLAEASGWSAEAPPRVRAGLEVPQAPPTLAAALRAAAEHHPELRVRRAALAEARARTNLADREGWPAPVLGVEVSREGSAQGAASYVVLGTLGVTLPLWQRNAGERARARVDEDVVRAEERASERALRSRIAEAHSALDFAARRVALFAAEVRPSLADSLALLQRAFDAGELPLLLVATARERFLRARGDALEAYADYYRALAELDFAMGAALPAAPPVPSNGDAR